MRAAVIISWSLLSLGGLLGAGLGCGARHGPKVDHHGTTVLEHHESAVEASRCGVVPLERLPLWRVPDVISEDEFVAAVITGRKQRLDLSKHDRASMLLTALSRQSMLGVRELRLASTSIDPGEIVQFVASSGRCIEILHLTGTTLTDKGFKSLCSATMPGLRVLMLDRTGITGASLSLLPTCTWAPTLESLTLAENDFSTTGVASSRVEDSVQLAQLDLSRSQCRTSCLTLLVTSGLLTRVEELHLEGFFGPDEARALMRGDSLQGLEYLALYGMWDLSEHSEDILGDKGCEILANSPSLRKVQRLELPTHGIGNACATALGRSPYGTALRYMNLRGNDIGDPGAQALIGGTITRALDGLDLRDNPISPAMKTMLREHYGSNVVMNP